MAASACFLSIRACVVSSAAVTVPGSVNSVAPVISDEIRTSLTLESLLESTWALALVRTTLVASAPAPATPTPAVPPKPAATLAAMAREWMLARSVAERTMSPSPSLVLTPMSALAINACTSLLIVFFAKPTPIDTAMPAAPPNEAATAAAPVKTSITEESSASSVIEEASTPPVPSLSIDALTFMPTVLMELAPAPARPTPAVPPAVTAADPANTVAVIVCVAVALAASAPVALTVESERKARVEPLIMFSASDAPRAAPTPAVPPAPTAAAAATTVASMVALLVAVRVSFPALVSTFFVAEASVEPSTVFFALAPAPLTVIPAVPPTAAESDAAAATAWIPAFSVAERTMSPLVVVTLASRIEAWTVLVIVFSASPTPIESATPALPASAAAIEAAAVSTLMVEVSLAESVIDAPFTPLLPSPSIDDLTVMPTVLMELAPAPPSPTPLLPAVTATEPARTKALIFWSAVAVAVIAPVAVTPELERYACVVPEIVLVASDTPIAAATPLVPTATEADTAATVASIVAVLVAVSARAPVVTIVLVCT